MSTFIQNVAIDDDDQDEAMLPPGDQIAANTEGDDDDEEMALPTPTIEFAINRRKSGKGRLTNLPMLECDECGFEFAPMNANATELKCPRCGSEIEDD